MEFFPEIEVGKEQAEAIARGLYAVAKADGTVHEREAMIIVDLFHETTDSAADLNALERSPAPEPAQLAAQLTGKPLRSMFIKTALLVAYADSAYGAKEKALIDQYARALELSPADVGTLEQQVKEYLVGQLAHLSNVQGAADVARKLKL
jgi:tellurite resistance protein